jgi:pimeloyl-ACP methyl ester carboxylesterase
MISRPKFSKDRYLHLLRTRFKKDIVAEFLPPRNKSSKVIILCPGMPGSPDKEEIIRFLSDRGFWAISPRYRGSWESDGKFLKISPEKDILDIIAELPKGLTSLFDGKKYKLKPKRIYLLGSSFGGPAAILASRNKKVEKAVVLSPVIDWACQGKTEDLDDLEKFVRTGYGQAFRYSRADWRKLKTGDFYNPMPLARKIDGRKILIIQAKDDRTVDYRPVRKFSQLSGSKLILLSRGGHLSISLMTKPKLYRYLREFIK